MYRHRGMKVRLICPYVWLIMAAVEGENKSDNIYMSEYLTTKVRPFLWVGVCGDCVCVSSTASRSRWSRGGRWRRAASDRVQACGPTSSGSDGHREPREGQTERERENLIQDKLNFLSHSPKYNLKLKTKKYFSGSENRIKGLSGLNGKKIKIIGEEK